MPPDSLERIILVTVTNSCRRCMVLMSFLATYHLNAEEEPENPDYPKNPEFKKKFGPRGVLHCWATDKEDSTEDMHYGRVGRQKIENTGPLNTKRMETIDE